MVVSTVAPTAFSRTRATKDFTTSKATSASSSETRMSRSDSSTSSGVISCFPASRFLAARKPLVTVSSIGGRVFNTGPGVVGPPATLSASGRPQGVDIKSAISTAMLMGFHSAMPEGNWTVTCPPQVLVPW